MKRIVDRLQADGIGRHGDAKTGFHYFLLATQEPVRDAPTLERIRHLAIPPAWRSVAISRSATHRVQAVGLDDDGRWQYRYHKDFRDRMERQKFHDILDFARTLPELRRVVSVHLRHDGLARDRVLGGMIRILDTGMIRVGNEEYAHDHHHYGLATLRHRHVIHEPGRIHFHFLGKSGELHDMDVRDEPVVRLVGQLLALPGPRLFRYEGEGGDLVPATAEAVNEYFKGVVGRAFSVKDFRTWIATVICGSLLAHYGPKESKRDQNFVIKSSLALTAATLGNTPAICKNSYVSPRVLDLYRQGIVISLDWKPRPEEIVRHCHGLHPAESATLKLLTTHGHGG